MATYDENNNPYRWMPGFLRRFLNLTYDEAPTTESGQASPSYAPPATTTTQASWTPPSNPSFTPSNMAGYRAPVGTPAVRSVPPPIESRPTNSGPGVAPVILTNGNIQPVTYLLRGFVGGALPPQGLEAFTKELRATSTDVWNLYSRWFNFQTADVFRFGRGVLESVTSYIALPAAGGVSTSARRIKVTVANGNGHDHAEPAANTSGEANKA